MKLYNISINELQDFEIDDYLARNDDLDSKMLATAKNRLASFPFFGISEQYKKSLYLFCFTYRPRPLIDTYYENTSIRNKAGIYYLNNTLKV